MNHYCAPINLMDPPAPTPNPTSPPPTPTAMPDQPLGVTILMPSHAIGAGSSTTLTTGKRRPSIVVRFHPAHSEGIRIFRSFKSRCVVDNLKDIEENGLDEIGKIWQRNYHDQNLDDLEAVPLTECQMKDVVQVFQDSLELHPIYGSRITDFQKEYQELEEDVPQDTINRFWTLYRLNGKYIGYALPALFRHNPEEGTVKFIGLLPEYTGKGYGWRIHLHALSLLAQMGAKTYIGSTETDNPAMIQVFKKNRCEVFATQYFFQKS